LAHKNDILEAYDISCGHWRRSNISLELMLAKFWRADAGGAALELIVILPLILLLLIGVADYGRAFFTSVAVTNAARAGAEFGAQGPSTSGDTVSMRKFAQSDAQEAGSITVSARRYCECAGVSHACTACAGGEAPAVFVEVTATKALSMLLPYPGLPRTVTISRTATFRSQ
jgi:Flp pilus assembly protein TadG